MHFVWRLRCEVNDEVLQLVPVGIVIIIPEIVFACSGRTAATAAVAEDGFTAALAHNVDDGCGNHLSWYNRCYLNCGLLICFFSLFYPPLI